MGRSMSLNGSAVRGINANNYLLHGANFHQKFGNDYVGSCSMIGNLNEKSYIRKVVGRAFC